jgi:hypothetical protein
MMEKVEKTKFYNSYFKKFYKFKLQFLVRWFTS